MSQFVQRILSRELGAPHVMQFVTNWKLIVRVVWREVAERQRLEPAAARLSFIGEFPHIDYFGLFTGA